MSAGSNRGYLLASEFGHKTQGEGVARAKERCLLSQGRATCVDEKVRGTPKGPCGGAGVPRGCGAERCSRGIRGKATRE